MEKTLTVTLTTESKTEYTVEVFDGESGDHVAKTLPYSPDDHRELDDWIGAEIYGWIDYMMEADDDE